MIFETVSLAISDRRFLRIEGHAHLRIGVARTVPARQRVGKHRQPALKLHLPAAGIGFPRLGGPAFKLRNARNRHVKWRGKVRAVNQAWRMRGSC